MEATHAHRSEETSKATHAAPNTLIQPGTKVEGGAATGMPMFLQRSTAAATPEMEQPESDLASLDKNSLEEEPGAEEEPLQAKLITPSSRPLIQRKCDECAAEEEQATNRDKDGVPIQRMPTTAETTTPDREEEPSDTEVEVQPQLKIGRPGDRFEQEADNMADRVMRTAKQSPEPGDEESQTATAESEATTRQSPKATNPEPEDTVPSIQTRASTGTHPHPRSVSVQNTLPQTKGNGRPLSSPVQTEMEQHFGHDLGAVRIHTDETSIRMNQRLNARAFTHETDVYFNSGEYHPDSWSGKHLLAHELTHVLQQNTLSARKFGNDPDHPSGSPAPASPQNSVQRIAHRSHNGTRASKGLPSLQRLNSPSDIVQPALYGSLEGASYLWLWVPFGDEIIYYSLALNLELTPYFEADSTLPANIENELERIFNPAEYDLHETPEYLASDAVKQVLMRGIRVLPHAGAYDFSELQNLLHTRTALFYSQALLSAVTEWIAPQLEVEPETIDWNALLPELRILADEFTPETMFDASLRDRYVMFLDMLESEASQLDPIVGAASISAEDADFYLMEYVSSNGSALFTQAVFEYHSEKFLEEYVLWLEELEYVPDGFDLEAFRPIRDTSRIDARREAIISQFIEEEAEGRIVMYILDRWTESGQSPEEFLGGVNLEDFREDLTAYLARELVDRARNDPELMADLRSHAADEARFIEVAAIYRYAIVLEDYNMSLWETFATVPLEELSDTELGIANDPWAYYHSSATIANVLYDLLSDLTPEGPIELEVLQAGIELLQAQDISSRYAAIFLLPELLGYLRALKNALEEQERETQQALQDRLDLDFDAISEVVNNHIEHAERFVREEWIPMLKQIAEERAAENLAELQYMDDNWEEVQRFRNLEFAQGAVELMYLANELESGRAEFVEYQGRRVGRDGVEHLRNAAQVLRAAGLANRDEDTQTENREKIQGVIRDYAQIIEDIRDGDYDPLDYSAAVYQEARQRLGIERMTPATVGMILSRRATADQNPFLEWAIVRWKFKEGIERDIERGMLLYALGILTLAAALVPGALGVVLAVIDVGLSIYMGVRGVLDAQSVLRMARLDIHGDIVGISEADAERALTHAWIGLGVTVVLTVGVGALQARMMLRRPGGVREPRLSPAIRTTTRESRLLSETRGLHGSRLSPTQLTGEAEMVARGRSQASRMPGFQEEVHLPNNHVWRRRGQTWCRFSIRPFCMPSRTLPRGLRRRGYRDAARTLDEAQDAFGRPLPRDINRRHSYADHGAQTTPQQQEIRLRTGVTPGGRPGTRPASASRFNTHRDHVEAFQRALDELSANYMNVTGTRPRIDYVAEIDMGRGIGTSYTLGPGPRATAPLQRQTVNRVHFWFRYDGHGWYDLVTMYPVP
jgi:hypothetical protein